MSLETLPNLETPFLVNLPDEPCTYDCTECVSAGRCLIDSPPQDEGYVHTDDDAPAPTRVVDELAAVLVRLRAQEFYKVPPLRSDVEILERLYADLAVLAQ